MPRGALSIETLEPLVVAHREWTQSNITHVTFAVRLTFQLADQRVALALPAEPFPEPSIAWSETELAAVLPAAGVLLSGLARAAAAAKPPGVARLCIRRMEATSAGPAVDPVVLIDDAIPLDASRLGRGDDTRWIEISNTAARAFNGAEWIRLEGCHPTADAIESQIPDVVPRVRIRRGSGAALAVPLRADCLRIDAPTGVCSIVWRGHTPIVPADSLGEHTALVGLERDGRPIAWPAPFELRVDPRAPRRPAAATQLDERRLKNIPQRPGLHAPVAQPAPIDPGEDETLPPPRSLGRAVRSTMALPRADLDRALEDATPFRASSPPAPAPSGRDPAPPLETRMTLATSRFVAGGLPPFVERRAAADPAPPERVVPLAPVVAPAPLPPPLEPTPLFPVPPPMGPALVDADDDSTAPPGSPEASQLHAPAFLGDSRGVSAAPAAPPSVAPPPSLDPARLRPRKSLARDQVVARLDRPDPLAGMDLSNVDLSGLDLSGKDLSRARLRGARLCETNLEDADLTGADLEGADLSDADLSGATLTRANLELSTLDRATFAGATLDGARFDLARGRGTDFREASGQRISLRKTVWADATFAHARMDMADFKDADVTDSNFSGAGLFRAQFERATLRRSKLDGARLDASSLRGANASACSFKKARMGFCALDQADLTGAKCGGVDMQSASLRGATLPHADLRDAALRGADLGGAALRSADFGGADLTDASLEDASAEGATFDGAKLDGANLRGAVLSRASFAAARLPGANLCDARLDRATLDRADLRDARLRRARLEGASTEGARLEGADLRDANLDAPKPIASLTKP